VTLAHLKSKQQTPLAVFRCCGLADTLYNSVSMPAKKGSAAKVAKTRSAAGDLYFVKLLMYWFQFAIGNGKPKEEVLGDFNEKLHNEFATFYTFPALLMLQDLLDSSMREESLSEMIKSFKPRHNPPGSFSMQWRLCKSSEEGPDGRILVAGVYYELANIPEVQKKLEQRKLEIVDKQQEKWNAEYEAALAATWQEYEKSFSPMDMRKHASVEKREAPDTMGMYKFEYVCTTDVLERFIAVRLEGGHVYVCSDAPCTLEWRKHQDILLGRNSMLATLGQMTEATKQGLERDPIRFVMDNLLRQSVQQE